MRCGFSFRIQSSGLWFATIQLWLPADHLGICNHNHLVCHIQFSFIDFSHHGMTNTLEGTIHCLPTALFYHTVILQTINYACEEPNNQETARKEQNQFLCNFDLLLESSISVDGFGCRHRMDWYSVECGWAPCPLVRVYVSIQLRVSQWVWVNREKFSTKDRVQLVMSLGTSLIWWTSPGITASSTWSGKSTGLLEA